MNIINKKVLVVCSAIFLGFMVICYSFDTLFADKTIDLVSFCSGTFLFLEALYKIRKYGKNSGTLLHICRLLRMIAGISVFGVHVIQFFWGVEANIISSDFMKYLIDWVAYFYGVFLVSEGTVRFIRQDEAMSCEDQVFRVLRIVIGSSIFTIHLLQFMRYMW